MAEVDIWTTVIVPLGVALVPSLLTYFGTRQQTNNALKTALAQQSVELQKLKEQQQADLEKLREQQQIELQKMREQNNAEINRMREQHSLDMAKMQFEMEKQAENYEKGLQADVTKGFFDKMLTGDTSVFENITNGIEKMDKLQKQMQSKGYKNKNHSATKKR